MAADVFKFGFDEFLCLIHIVSHCRTVLITLKLHKLRVNQSISSI